MAKMTTLKRLAAGSVPLKPPDEARIERNLFAEHGDTFEALRFCKNRNGRHNRVHLVISEADFVGLFADAVQNQVFGETTLASLLDILERRRGGKPPQARDPFRGVIGIIEDGTLSQGIDEELYGEHEE